MVDKQLYTTVLCQTFSPCGKYLFCGDTFGVLTIFDLEKILTPDESSIKGDTKPKIKLTLNEDEQICSFAKTEKFLIVGMVGEISGYNWKTLLTSTKTPKPLWTIQLPKAKDNIDKNEVNTMWFDEKNSLLYTGCGDHNIHVYSLEDGRCVRTIEAHDDFIHCIHYHGGLLASSSEDGSVKTWDLRDKQMTSIFVPHKEPRLSRPHLGNWVGAVALSDNWLLCGGGPRPALWHLNSRDVTTVFNTQDNGIHVLEFYEDRILAGGEAKFFYQFSYNNDVYAEIPQSSTSVYSVIHQEEPFKLLCLAGSSPKIDLCTNFTYRDQILSTY